jgi:hypothetical protein
MSDTSLDLDATPGMRKGLTVGPFLSVTDKGYVRLQRPLPCCD